MKGQGFIVALILAATIVFVGVFWISTNPEIVSDPNVQYQEEEESIYVSETYGFSLVYPSALDINIYTPQAVSIGIPEGEGFDPYVEILVAPSGGGGAYENYDVYLFERSMALCRADGPSESIDCDRIEGRRSFETDTGTQGEELYLRLVYENIDSGSSTESRFGPIYAFNISPNVPTSDFTTLLIYRPLPSFLRNGTTTSLRGIAESLSINRLETSE